MSLLLNVKRITAVKVHDDPHEEAEHFETPNRSLVYHHRFVEDLCSDRHAVMHLHPCDCGPGHV